MRKVISWGRNESGEITGEKPTGFNIRLFGNDGSGDDGSEDDDDSADDDPGEDDEDKGDDKKNKNAKTYTQEEVARLLRMERNQGRREVYKKFGLSGKQDGMIEKVNKFISDEKAKNTPENIKAQQAIKDAESRAMMAEIKVGALSAGVKKECLDDMIAIAMPKIEDDTDELDKIFDELKKKYPFMFSGSEEENKEGTGSAGVGGEQKKKKQNEDFGKSWAKAAKQNAPKTKFFSRS